MPKPILKHARTLKPRALLLFGAIFCVVAGLSVALMGRSGDPLQTQISTSAKVPQITAIPGNVTSEKYQSLQEEDNQKRVQAAQKTGGSAVATIIGTRSKDTLEKQQTLGIEDQFGPCPQCPTCPCNQKEGLSAASQKCPPNRDIAIQAALHHKAAALQLLRDCPSLSEAFAARNPLLYKQLLLENPSLAQQITAANTPAESLKVLPTLNKQPLPTVAERDRERVQSMEAMRQQQQVARAQAARQSQLNDQQQKQLTLLMANMENQSKRVVKNLDEVDKQQFVQGDEAKKTALETAGGSNGSNASTPSINQPILIKAGSILYASLDTAVNSDEPGPVMATIAQGYFKGAKVIGTLQAAPSTAGNRPEKVVLNFKTFSPVDAPKSLTINAVAVDPDSARTALASDVDHHYLLRYGTLLGSAFMSGYAKVISSQGSTVQTNVASGTTTTQTPPLNGKQQIFAALGQVGQSVGDATGAYFNTPNTIKVDQGTGFGLLILDDVSEQ